MRVPSLQCAGPSPAMRLRRPNMAQVQFCISDDRLARVDRAAAIRGMTRTEFVVRSS